MARQSRLGERAHRARFIMRPLFAALVASGLAAPAGLQAATILVTTGGDAGTPGTCTLRQAVDSMNGGVLVANCQNTGAIFGIGDNVDLSPQSGTISLAGATEITVVHSGLVINGPGAGVLTVSGAGASRVFANPLIGPSFTLDINGLTVANGLSAGPGGCILGAGTVRLLNSVVTGCTAQHSADFPSVGGANYFNGFGGGVAALDVRLTNSTVSGNTAQTAGGGIFAKYQALLDHSLVANNNVTGHTCNLSTSGLYCVLAVFGGGGMLANEAQLIHSTVSGNTVHASIVSKYDSGTQTTNTYNSGIGGGVSQIPFAYVFSPDVASAKSTLFGPRSAEARAARRAETAAARSKARVGGARTKADGYADYDYTLAMRSSTISGNHVTGNHANEGKYFGGGAFALSKYNAEIANSTISSNVLDTAGEVLIGGGLVATSADIFNSTITGNNGIVAVAFTYSQNALAPPVAKAAKSAKVAAFAAAMRGKLAGLRGTHAKAAGAPRNKETTQPVMVSTIVGANPADYDVGCGGSSCTIAGANNLVQNPDPGVTLPPDTIIGQNPRLAPLASNGGQIAGSPGHPLTGAVPTHLLFIGSPAIDTGLNPESFAFEERGAGFPRELGLAPDIGATEGSIAPDVPVPALGAWLVAALSALLGVLGLASRRRREA